MPRQLWNVPDGRTAILTVIAGQGDQGVDAAGLPDTTGLKPSPMENEVNIEAAAKELVGRHGKVAAEIARRRADELAHSGELKEADLAYRLLNEVERLVQAEKVGP